MEDSTNTYTATAKDLETTAYEKINFTPTNEIERALPVILADNAKMSLHIWNKFCDKIDECTSPLNKVGCISKIIWFSILVMIILNATGWRIVGGGGGDGNGADGGGGGGGGSGFEAYYGLMVPGTIILLLLVCHLESYYNKKAASKISQACASASNHDRDLTMKLKGDNHHSWYIEVTLRNAIDVEQDYAAAVAATTPVVAAAAETPASQGPTPKKYLKGEDGKMVLNPEYKAWKNSQQ